ncbi:OmpA family protein [Pengzhenrongella sicca]|uniref:OmpA family protein n=1 Tax=Pengzhenrongella sicca TaxID=2819238 RepID=A0A8A4ZER9_9MICO|nr:OmpA family protein [Pengzhenrongella sicca]QTE29046.1 OmpA family protein [Pengzhenrongella sicca]
MRRAVGLVVLVALAAVGCTAGSGGSEPTESLGVAYLVESDPSADASAAADVAAQAAFERDLRQLLTLPPIPSFTIPTQALSSAENQRISAELELEPGLYQGIAVLDARCTDAGDAAPADGAAGAAGAAGSTGAAQHFDDGTVDVTIGADGTGTYDAPDLHVAVLAGGGGVYDDGTTRVSVAADGSGTYSSGERRFTVRADRSGSYSDADTRIWFDDSGAGGYEDADMRLSFTAAGSMFGDGEPAAVAAVQAVLADRLPLFPPVPSLKPIEPTGTVCGTVIRLDANVLFEFDRAEVQPDGQAYLQRVATLLAAVGSPRAQINGYTDQVGDEEYNVDLSTRRADAVRDLLVGFGLSPDSLSTAGLGETRPLRPETHPDGTDDPAARQLNRRVEIVLPNS